MRRPIQAAGEAKKCEKNWVEQSVVATYRTTTYWMQLVGATERTELRGEIAAGVYSFCFCGGAIYFFLSWPPPNMALLLPLSVSWA